MIRVKIASPQEIVPLDYPRLRETARIVLEGEDIVEARVSLAFVDNPTIHRLNKQFLNHDEPTDVLSFPMSGTGAKSFEGELVIGVEVASENAAERGHAVDLELTLYIIHGLLHLCGYNDHNDTDTKAMRSRERHYLTKLGCPDIA